MNTLVSDIRYAARSLAKTPGFTFVVLLTLALGIGANTAIFSLINGILLRPFPYRAPERLVRIQNYNVKTPGTLHGCSLLDVEDWRRLQRTLDGVGAHITFDTDVRGDGVSEPVKMSQLNPEALSLLGVNPVLGRLLLPEENVPGADVFKVLISHGLWRQRFNSDPQIIGRTIQTAMHPFTVVGVMPPGFKFPEEAEVWAPMESWYAMAVGDGQIKKRDQRFYPVIARLKAGVTLAQAEADLNNVAAALEREHPKENGGLRVKLTPLRDAEVGNIRPYLFLLLAAVVFVLLICCANVANLQLARAAVRQREYALRAALGASRARLLRDSLLESLLLSLGGAALGVGLAVLALRALLLLIPVQLPFWIRIEIDAPVLVFSLGIALLTTLLAGVVPALFASRIDLNSVLKEGAKGSAGGGRVRGSLVVAEMALSLVLLVCAGLMMQSFLHLQRLETGFDSQNLLMARVTNFRPGSRVEKATALAAFHNEVVERLRNLPGVLATSATNSVPYSHLRAERSKGQILIKGESEEETRQTHPIAGADVSAGYLEMLNIPLKRGRYFDARDSATSPMVVIINERAAETLWPGRDPIGQEVVWGAFSAENPYCRVVGVVGNVRHQAVEDANGFELYYPHTQYPVNNAYYVIRTQGPPARLAPSVRQVVHTADRNAAIVFIKTMDELMSETLWQRRLWGALFGVFAGIALLLGAVGIYSVMSYSVAQRTREIGVRMALGAPRGNVLKLMVGDGLKLALIGIACGLAVALACARLLSSLLYGVGAADPLTLGAVSLILGVVALLACYLPARRAAGVNPIEALRQ